ncbi:unnamed protein product [Rotaria socialis]|uniref:Uncharacterized protein n=1 Tax=Rotaria socialis TaxID=392032 RepID=A0A820T1N2_9BILA|nr:unnamed protein product [Rotaria socialis]CAF4483652.1 unnamed protein product [Rotaria socialis]CAF4753453.1 unnamed protein product [Rotaria socialis]
MLMLVSVVIDPDIISLEISELELRYLTERLQDHEHMCDYDIKSTLVELKHFYTVLKNKDGITEILDHVPCWFGNTEEIDESSNSDQELDSITTYNTILSIFGAENVNKTVWYISEHELTTIQPEQIIREQPREIDNIFALGSGEKISRVYVKKPGGCGCEPTFTVTLTDARILQRRQDWACCGTGTRVDNMLFLSDISTISDAASGRSSCPSLNCCSIICCIMCCICGLCCKNSRGKEIAIRGGFGEEIFTFALADVPSALADIPAAAIPHKTSLHRY